MKQCAHKTKIKISDCLYCFEYFKILESRIMQPSCEIYSHILEIDDYSEVQPS